MYSTVSAAYTRVQQVQTRGQYAFRVTTCKARGQTIDTRVPHALGFPRADFGVIVANFG